MPLFSNYCKHLCEVELSADLSITTTYCNRLSAETDMRTQLSFTESDIKDIYKYLKQNTSILICFKFRKKYC